MDFNYRLIYIGWSFVQQLNAFHRILYKPAEWWYLSCSRQEHAFHSLLFAVDIRVPYATWFDNSHKTCVPTLKLKLRSMCIYRNLQRYMLYVNLSKSSDERRDYWWTTLVVARVAPHEGFRLWMRCKERHEVRGTRTTVKNDRNHWSFEWHLPWFLSSDCCSRYLSGDREIS